MGFILAATQLHATPKLTSDAEIATAGYFRLSWTAPRRDWEHPNLYELQQADNPVFTGAATIYQGPDEATVVSGLSNLVRYYRLRVVGEPNWSDTVAVEVRHHSLSRAMGFFALGAVMFGVMVAVLFEGNRRTSDDR